MFWAHTKPPSIWKFPLELDSSMFGIFSICIGSIFMWRVSIIVIVETWPKTIFLYETVVLLNEYIYMNTNAIKLILFTQDTIISKNIKNHQEYKIY